MEDYRRALYKNCIPHWLHNFLPTDNKKIWTKGHGQTNSGGLAIANVGYQKPQLSQDLNSILFQRNFFYWIRPFKTLIVEIDIKTSDEVCICKKCSEPEYVPNTNLIFYKKNKKFYVYNKTTAKSKEVKYKYVYVFL